MPASMMRGWMLRALMMFAAAMLLAACGRSHVVREGGASRPASTPKYGSTVVVQRGQTLYRIATSNGISALDLAMWNGIPSPYTIYPGQRLRLYPAGSGASTGGTRKPSPGNTASRAPTKPAVVEPVAPVDSPVPWRWPTEGSLIGTYANGDPTRQGIDIAGSGGQAVRAAGDGVVVYSGSGLVGYGELIIVKHNEQWLSAYGHNRSRLVNEGQIVKAGQQIAEMGRSGAARDMLHFEIRYNGKPVNPLAYLPGKR